MNVRQKIRTSFSTQLSLWVAGFVTVISSVVVLLLARFSQQVITDESMETIQQVLENTALRIDNTLSLVDLTARMEHRTVMIDRAYIERLIDDSNYLFTLHQTFPNTRLSVTDIKPDADHALLFLAPLCNGRYNLVITCPPEDIRDQFRDMRLLILVTGFAGMFILLFILHTVIGRHLRPLHTLADAAQHIAHGHLNAPIPDSRHVDEIGQLQNSLSKMQRVLAAYMDEMQEKQSVLSRQNVKLEQAYAEANEYERMKTRFLHDMTVSMTPPVEVVCRQTNTLCRDCKTLTPVGMAMLQIDIAMATEAITQLLDQLLAPQTTTVNAIKTFDAAHETSL